MGGNALLSVKTERKSKERYEQIMHVVHGTLNKLFPATRTASIQSIAGKDSFGDGDVLIDCRWLPKDWIYQVVHTFAADEVMINRMKAPGIRRASALRYVREGKFENVGPDAHPLTELPREAMPCSSVSFDLDNFQIDLIVTQPEDFEIAQVYYAYNDLGNLMGRIADRMGMKYGWDGLWKNVGDGNNIYTSVLVSRDPAEIFGFLGYDFTRWQMGFEQFVNMFEFAASTPWFNRAPYQFENRNHKDRIRDLKRTSYQAFVAWMEDKPWLDKYTWLTYERDETLPEREREKQTHLNRARYAFPQFRERYDEAIEDNRLAQEAKKVWNGGIVGVATGLSGEALGTFMRQCREKHSASSFRKFDAWIIERTPEQIQDFIMDNLRVLA